MEAPLKKIRLRMHRTCQTEKRKKYVQLETLLFFRVGLAGVC